MESLVQSVHSSTSPTPSISSDLETAWRLITRLGTWGIQSGYSLIRHLLTLTLHLPTLLLHLAHTSISLTFHLTFLKLVVFFLLLSSGASYLWKVRYLNRYTELRHLEGGNYRRKAEREGEGDLHPDLTSDPASAGFHNYLDEFLSAIKVFGYLEKPVFHELARHLQTRRLVAGDKLDLSRDKSFYIVVDGKVEVFADTGGADGEARDRGEALQAEGDGERWQLLNCVESGGTLSSLFTILSLFTEDVKLRYEEEEVLASPFPLSPAVGGEEEERNKDVSTFDLNDPPKPVRPHFPGYSNRNSRRMKTPSLASPASPSLAERSDEDEHSSAAEDTSAADPSSAAAAPLTSGLFSPLRTSPQPPQTAFLRPPLSSQASSSSLPSSSSVSSFIRPPLSTHPSRRSSTASPNPLPYSSPAGRDGSGPRREGHGLGRKEEATVARAATDTTLAVIPAEAFRRLTKKFPDAAAHIVAVILTRLQRVTFLTSHAYLGLTREVLKTEQAINDLACYPLPEEFWENGGIQKLRARFVPETRLGGPEDVEGGGSGGGGSGGGGTGGEREDYFGNGVAGRRRSSGGDKGGKKVRIAAGNTGGGGNGRTGGSGGGRAQAARRSNLPLETPYAGPRMGEVFWGAENEASQRNGGVRLKYRPSPAASLSPASLAPGSSRRQRSLSGGAVGALSSPSLVGSSNGTGKTSSSLGRKAGDLLSMSTLSPLSNTTSGVTAPPRLDRLNTTAVLSGALAGGEAGEFDLRAAVMECISKAIGLVQPQVTPAASADASPVVRPRDALASPGGTLRGQAAFNSSFGSLSFLGMQGGDDEDGSSSPMSPSSSSSSSRPFPLSPLSSSHPSPSTSASSAGGVGSFASMDLENEVEILYFPQGSVLVKEGERNAGLYFVIGGELDVAMPEVQVGMGTGGVFAGAKKAKETPSRPSPSPRTSTQSRTTSTTKGGLGVTGGPPPQSSSPSAEPPSSSSQAKPKKSIPLFIVRPGGIAGYLSSLSGFPSYVDITAKTECYVGFLPARALERIMDRKPIVLLTLAKRLSGLLSPLVLHIDSALDWMHVSAGQVIYREGDEADSFYIVINGRLRSILEKPSGGVHVQAEYGQGESVGELDCITASHRPSTLHAIRDTELARMPMTLFNAISVRHPLVTIQISRIIAKRLRGQVQVEGRLGVGLGKELGAPVGLEGGMGKNNFNLKTVAIIPTNRHVPVSEFASKLHQALETIGAPTSYLNQATVMQVLGRHAFSRMGQLKLAGWLAETEQKYRIVLYVADTAVSAPWTQTCIRQADCIFVVGDAGAEPELGEHEKLLVSMKTTARKELVLLHAERNVPSGSTRPWLKNRPWIHAHHHVEMLGATPESHRPLDDPAAVVALRKIAAKVEIQISKYKKTVPRPVPQRDSALSDFARLARRLCGKSIGVVLGGGGARGISHIGALRALQERNIPVDMVGGTSIGSFIGGLYAKEGDLVSTYGRAKRFSGRMSTLWRILTDLTYPVVAYTTGHEFNRGIYKSFYASHIEDFWLPFFCNTTNITHSRMDVHTTGYAWRYVRASMSLAGLLPPLCDEGDMLVDGGYVDNLPVSVMLQQGAASVFAVDVGSVDDTDPRNYGESVSGWWLLLQRWNPFGAAPNVPNITEIQSRLTYVSSVKTLEEAKQTPGVLYMRMPVTQFGTMDFKRFLEILDVGSEFANELLNEWAAKGQLPTGMEGDVSQQKKQKRGQSIRRNSI
ncbi:hypothetical protein JCM11641_001102 [Rhodosporidiobolus odoratus]